jgi:hypothetical protein
MAEKFRKRIEEDQRKEGKTSGSFRTGKKITVSDAVPPTITDFE